MKAPLQIHTPRLILSCPDGDDADEIFERYANDPEVTRLVGWPRHQSVEFPNLAPGVLTDAACYAMVLTT
jgi:RimJ/RimL family protein N-acetyltransferase